VNVDYDPDFDETVFTIQEEQQIENELTEYNNQLKTREGVKAKDISKKIEEKRAQLRQIKIEEKRQKKRILIIEEARAKVQKNKEERERKDMEEKSKREAEEKEKSVLNEKKKQQEIERQKHALETTVNIVGTLVKNRLKESVAIHTANFYFESEVEGNRERNERRNQNQHATKWLQEIKSLLADLRQDSNDEEDDEFNYKKLISLLMIKL